MSRSRWGMIAAGVVVFALVASQILVPAIGERKVVDRLTENGGSADVTLGAVPALRLVWGDGERFAVSARDLDLDLDEPVDVFDRLDGFSIVDVSISSSKAGPVDLESFRLTRDAPAPYHLVSTGTTAAERLVDYGLGGIEVPGETLLDTILGELLGPAETAVPVRLDMELTSEDGRIQVVSGGGTVAGVPTGPLAELITSAVVIRL
jgi:hypothetical protein